jgi:hypothetical protein
MLQNADLRRRFGLVPACVPVVMDELGLLLESSTYAFGKYSFL